MSTKILVTLNISPAAGLRVFIKMFIRVRQRVDGFLILFPLRVFEPDGIITLPRC